MHDSPISKSREDNGPYLNSCLRIKLEPGY